VVHFARSLAALPGGRSDTSVAGASKLEPRHACWCLACFLVVQGFSFWLGNTASPLALPGAAHLAARPGAGTPQALGLAGLGQLVVAQPLDDYSEVRLIVAAGRRRSRRSWRATAQVGPSWFRWRSCCPVGRPRLQWLMLQIRWRSLAWPPPDACPAAADIGREALRWAAC